MPSQDPIPSLTEYLTAFAAGARLQRRSVDARRGSGYDEWGGPGAILFRRLTERVKREAQHLYLGSSSGERRDELVARRFAMERVRAARGAGSISVSRPDAAAGEGLFLRGTRVQVVEPSLARRFYRVSSDTLVGAADTTATIPVESEDAKAGVAVTGEAEDFRIELIDPLWDASWAVDSIECSDGSDDQAPEDILRQIREERFARRPGYRDSIERACRAAGASVVAFFPSDWLGNESDSGLNFVAVGDPGYESNDALIRACRIAITRAAVAGAGTQVVGMTKEPLALTIALTFWDRRFDSDESRLAAAHAVLAYFDRRDNPFIWSLDALRGALWRSIRGLQEVTFVSPPTPPEPAAIFETIPLKRYSVHRNAVVITVA